MSDGPHRSLPMRPQWKTVAERASKDAWSIAEVSEAMFHALECDLAEIPVRLLRRILGAGGAASLFSVNPDALTAELDRARTECRGSAIGNAAIDGMIQAVRDGHAGDAACEHGFSYALDRTCMDYSRSIEEHYRRQAGSWSAHHMRERLAAVRSASDFTVLARRCAAPETKAPRSAPVERRTALDDGPAIPL